MKTLENKVLKKVSASSVYALLFLATILCLSVLLEGCTDSCEVTHQYTYYEPVYTNLSEIRSSVGVDVPHSITSLGKIYFKDNFLFVNQPGEGIHVIDNHDPAKPVVKSFIKIPGTYDLAIKGNTLYADSYIDLVVLDISNINAIHEINRMENLFSNYNSLGFYVDINKGVVTDWNETSKVEIHHSDCHSNTMLESWGGMRFAEGVAFADASSFNKSAAIAPGNGSGPGVGGSMARFTISSDHLYALDAGHLQAVDVTSEKSPVKGGRTLVSWDMETIFPYKNNLLIGSQTGMHIIDITDPQAPVKVSVYQHLRVCDPVVAQGDLAYVTLRSGNQCQGFTNQLEVIDISNLASPQLLHTYPMTNPHGLGIDNTTLFVCDGDAGLKIFNASDVSKIDKNRLAVYSNINAYDVIPFNNLLMMIGKDGIFQYDYTNPTDIKFLSKISIVNAK